MSDTPVVAQQAIRHILAELNIRTVICIDDVYGLDDADTSAALVLEWLAEALSLGKLEECNELLEQFLGEPAFLDVTDDEVWRFRLRDRWQGLDDGKRIAILDSLAEILGTEVNIARDQRSASVLKDLVPGNVLVELAPAAWENKRDELLGKASGQNGVLCLFDHNLRGAHGYTEDRGLMLLDQAIDVRGDRPVICGLLTHMAKEGEEVMKNGEFAERVHRKRKEFLVLSKDRLDDPMRFAHGLKMMSLNHTRDFLTDRVKEIAQMANDKANEALMDVDIYNFDYMVLRSSEEEGVWEAETLFRLFEILRREAFRKAAFDSANRTVLDSRITQIRTIREVTTLPDTHECPPNQRWELMRLELYETGEFVNAAHLPLELGDIFGLGNEKYILIAQSCDLMIRTDGCRKAQSVIIARIRASQDPEKLNPMFNFPLKYFVLDSRTHGVVKFREAYHISPDVLDLAVLHADGICRFDPSVTLPSLHAPWRNRFEAIRETFRQHQARLDEIYGNVTNLENETGEYLRSSLTHRITMSNLGIPLTYDNGVFDFGLQRVGRYRQPGAAELLSCYMASLSRYAESRDFAELKQGN